jgi:hypothetical protein
VPEGSVVNIVAMHHDSPVLLGMPASAWADRRNH